MFIRLLLCWSDISKNVWVFDYVPASSRPPDQIFFSPLVARQRRWDKFLSGFGCRVILPTSLAMGVYLMLYTGVAFALNMLLADACVLPSKIVPLVITENGVAFNSFVIGCRGPIRNFVQSIDGAVERINSVCSSDDSLPDGVIEFALPFV